MIKRFLVFFLIIPAFLPLHAFQTDSLQVSLLTVMPRANEVYTIYGHTALRLYDPGQQINTVFNWGTFNVEEPHFLYHFIKGETNYFLSYIDYSYFLYAYSQGNASITEQQLNLTPEAKEKLVQMLDANMQPENLFYRYDFLFNNCTTRVRDLIEQSCDTPLIYPGQTQATTFRKLIHSCTEPYPWMTFGIDLLIGSGADSIIGMRQELFLPQQLQEALDGTRYTVHGARYEPVVSASEQVLTSVNKSVNEIKFWDSPVIVGFVLFFIIFILVVIAGLKKRLFRGFFAPLFFVAGIAGCLIAYVTLFSYHPCTSPNWNLLWLHPFHLIACAGYFIKRRISSVMSRAVVWYHAINFVLLSIILLGWHWIPQELNTANIPYILCLWLVSGQYWVHGTRYTVHGK